MAKTYRELLVWQEAMALAKGIYVVTKVFPKEERFGLISQMRRAAVSIPSNIAEGHGKSSAAHFLSYLGHARGSLFELETQAELSCEFGFISAADMVELSLMTTRLGRMLSRFMETQE